MRTSSWPQFAMFPSLEASGQFLSRLTTLTSKFCSVFANQDIRPNIIVPITPELRLSGARRSTWLSLIIFFFDPSTAFWDLVTYSIGIVTAHVCFANLFPF